MPIHDCFTALRKKHPYNTSTLSGVAVTAPKKMLETQRDKTSATPATPETPSDDLHVEQWRDAYEERAAIYEFDAGHCRSEAEWRAMNDMLLQYSAAHGVSLGSDELYRFMCDLHRATGFNPQPQGV